MFQECNCGCGPCRENANLLSSYFSAFRSSKSLRDIFCSGSVAFAIVLNLNMFNEVQLKNHFNNQKMALSGAHSSVKAQQPSY